MRLVYTVSIRRIKAAASCEGLLVALHDAVSELEGNPSDLR